MSRYSYQMYPDLTAFLPEIRQNGISEGLLQKIIERHQQIYLCNKSLYERYLTQRDAIPIFNRSPRFEEDKPINNKINNDLFSK